MVKTEKKRVFDENEWKTLVKNLSLSKKQIQVIKCLFNGNSDKQISQEMKIALPTVRTHMRRLFDKFDVQNRCELILYIFRYFRHHNRTDIWI